ncbi:MAG TPA: neutral/alkaline non-lysosomal ceramidase N-terminal domain-containing protein [Terriglobia bacterium]|nr:neutral/alkaline non-lysosomal ceramidase N-terminal domain-containing protein [Terriglobia bacterium]
MRSTMKTVLKLWLGWCLLASVFAGGARADTLKAGVAKVDITPAPGLPLWGFENRKTPATGTRDPLYARVLVLEAGETRLALVALDLGRCFGPASLQHLRELAGKRSGISYLLAVASHTHSAPVISDSYPQGPQCVPAWETSTLEKIAAAIDEARQHAVEARLGTGYGVAYIGHNRLAHNPDGTVSWFERNTTRIPTAPIDPTVSVLRVDTADGKPLAILVNYACHPVVFGSDNLEYSADFPGVMTKTVEDTFAGQPLCIFLQGAPGDINPFYAVTPVEQGAEKWRDWSGQRLGEEAARVAKQIHTEAAPSACLDYAENQLTFSLRWDLDKFRQALMQALGPQGFLVYATSLAPQFQLPVGTVLINRRIAFMTMPGEPFVDLQVNWRDRCPVRDAFFLGYANGYYGYFPTIRASTEGGYGAASSSTWIEVGAGERMVDHAVIQTYRMLGRYRDLPEDMQPKTAMNR